MQYQQGDIVLIKFPFTDLTNYKLRPALIVSNKQFNAFDNIMLIGIYGNKGNTNYSLSLSQNDLTNGKLKKQSYFRFQNIFSLEKSLIEKKIANIKKDCLKTVNQRIEKYLEII